MKDIQIKDKNSKKIVIKGEYTNKKVAVEQNKHKLSQVDLRGTDLKGADLSNANFSGTDLRWTDLSDANLTGANLTGADLDFSCFPLRDESFGVNVSKKFVVQMLYHICRLKCDDAEIKQLQEDVKSLANTFHKVKDKTCEFLD